MCSIYSNTPGRNEAFHLLLPGTQCYIAVQDTVRTGLVGTLAEVTYTARWRGRIGTEMETVSLGSSSTLDS